MSQFFDFFVTKAHQEHSFKRQRYFTLKHVKNIRTANLHDPSEGLMMRSLTSIF